MRNRTLARRAITVIKAGIAFLFRADFCIDETAPISSPLSVDMGSDLTIIQVDGNIEIVGGAMDIPAQATPVFGDLGFFSVDSFTRENGLVAFFSLSFSTLDDAALGFLDTQDVLNTSYDNIGVAVNGTELEARFTSDATSPDIFTLSTSVDYVVALVLRTSGRFIYLFDETNWFLLWVDSEDSTATLFIGYANLSSVVSLDSLRISQLATSLFVPSIDVAALPLNEGSVSGGELEFPDGDTFFEYDLDTLPSASSIQVNFRYFDSDNFWNIRINSSGNFDLRETVAGVAVNRITNAGVLAGGEKIRIVARGNDIELFFDTTSAGSITDAFNFIRATDWTVPTLGTGGVISNLKVWKAYARNENGRGSDVVVNGGFATDTVWTKGTGWSIGSGVASCDGTQVAVTDLTQTLILVSGTYYEITYTISNYVAGTISIRAGGNQIAAQDENGTFTRGVISGGTSFKLRANSSFVGDVDNVIIKEILFTPDSLRKKFNQSLLGDCVGNGFSSGFSDGFS